MLTTNPKGTLAEAEIAAAAIEAGIGVASVVTLRLARSRSNQLLGIRWARDYEFRATLRRLAGP
ncbi:MAG TPA: hypothetical protein VFA19_06440 [Gaiellaceae bacterium]|nr:hypothetical protein [Gaiellaceae bacterium]